MLGVARRNFRASLAARARYLLHMAARAWPGAADGSKWLLEPAPEPQMARNGRSSPPRSRKYSKSAARVCPGAAECSTGAARVCPGTAECPTGAARATPDAQNARRSRSMLEKCCSSHGREVRSFLAFEMAARKLLPHVRLLSVSTSAQLHFASCMLCTGSH